MTDTAEAACHQTRSGTLLLDTYAIETPTCCGLTFEAHDGKVTDHVVETTWLWNAQLHDMVDNIERQAREPLEQAVRLLQENWPKTIPAPMDTPAPEHRRSER